MTCSVLLHLLGITEFLDYFSNLNADTQMTRVWCYLEWICLIPEYGMILAFIMFMDVFLHK